MYNAHNDGDNDRNPDEYDKSLMLLQLFCSWECLVAGTVAAKQTVWRGYIEIETLRMAMLWKPVLGQFNESHNALLVFLPVKYFPALMVTHKRGAQGHARSQQ